MGGPFVSPPSGILPQSLLPRSDIFLRQSSSIGHLPLSVSPSSIVGYLCQSIHWAILFLTPVRHRCLDESVTGVSPSVGLQGSGGDGLEKSQEQLFTPSMIQSP
ncbi:hypothetical protein Pcinc_028639 [Petrolisthes cinctipes]|uniref:Uncharacterized protein n=1 Tax=Petrolisthes cinctipes TaxID=88211 RepID=A0AAE1F383_PETCI|nr:hypothetical protein Pcinc_028639 [Petrolisthes cinctipes]